MTKADLIESVATKLDLPKGQAERAVNMIFETSSVRSATATR